MPVKRTYRIIFLLLFTMLVWWVMAVTPFVDAIYVPVIYPSVHYGITQLSYLFPFPVGEILYAAAITLAVIYAGGRLRTLKSWKGWQAFIEKALFAGCIIYLVFLFMWGMNYYRQPVYEHYNVLAEAPSLSDYAGAAIYLAMLTDSLWHVGNDTGDYMQALKNANWKVYTPGITDVRVKSSLIPATEDFLGIDGYFNPFTGEGQAQNGLPAIVLPFVRLHEAAHVCGVASEADANWCAYNAGLTASYPRLAASTSFNVLLYVLHNLRVADTGHYNAVLKQLPVFVTDQMRAVRKYYQSRRSPVEGIMHRLFSGYLKLNGQSLGVESYNNIGDWATIDLLNKNLLKRR